MEKEEERQEVVEGDSMARERVMRSRKRQTEKEHGGTKEGQTQEPE